MSYLKIILLTTIISSLILAGCNIVQTTFNNYNEAKEALLKEENLTLGNIVEEFAMSGDYLILFEQIQNSEAVYALAHFKELEDGNFIRDNTSSKLSIEGTEDSRPVGIEYETLDGRKVSLTIGIYNDEESFNNLDEDLKKGIIRVNKEKNIYYIVNITKLNGY